MRSWIALPLLVACGGSAPDPVDEVSSEGYAADLQMIAAPRSPGTAHWQAVQDFCAARFEAYGYTVERHAYATGVNVIGVLPGKSEERVMISAHYDSVENCAGADDNGTGVAAILQAARVLAKQSHERTLVVACWDEEERGLIGSAAYVTRAKAAAEPIVLSLVYETIGYRSTEPMSQKTDAQLEAVFPDASEQIKANDYRGDFALVVNDVSAAQAVIDIQDVGAKLGIPVVNISLLAELKTALDALRRSDHAPFWDADYPALFITDTADYRNPHYHCGGGPDAFADIDIDFAVGNTKLAVGAAAKALDR